MKNKWFLAFCAVLSGLVSPSLAQAMNDPAQVLLTPYKDPWPAAKPRYWDINNRPFADFIAEIGGSDPFQYTAPSPNQYVQITYDRAPGVPYFVGHVEARGLKPNFAYQIKLVGKPTKGSRGWGAYGDDVANERLGYAGRWWCDSSHATQTNFDDSHFVNFYKNAPGNGNAAHNIYGYHFLGVFVTDEWGNADHDFDGYYSYHITWASWQGGAKQVFAGNFPVQSLTAPFYGYGSQVPTSNVGLWYEYEQNMNPSRSLTVTLPPGNYNCRMVLTEETFHNSSSNSVGGFWQTVLGSEDFAKDANNNYLTDANGNLIPDSDPLNDITFSVAPPNIPPVAAGQSVSVPLNTAKSITLSASDADGDALTYSIVAAPTRGTLGAINGAQVIYTPTSGYAGADSFTFRATDARGGVSDAATVSITVTNQPTITSFSPAGAAPGATVTINGSSFTGASAVNFNGQSAAFTVISATKISATVPANAFSGPLSVTTPNGTTQSATSFTVAPRLTSFTPSSGLVGTVVTVTGQNLSNVTKTSINGVSGAITNRTATSVTFTVPNAATSGPITVINPGGSAVSATVFTVLPKITSFSPAGAAPGATVTINGSGFGGANAVTLNGQSAAFTVVSANKITATVPANALSGPFVVTTPAGAAQSINSFTVAPRIASFSPVSGTVGSAVTVTGENLANATAKLNGVTTTLQTRSATSLTFTVPTTATSGPITVTNPGGSAVLATNFAVFPKITSFSPAKGVPGTTVTINGYTLGGATNVLFNGQSVGAGNFTQVSTARITAIAPPGVTTGKISIATPAGTALSATDFAAAPRITGVTPNSGRIGEGITISGANLQGATVKIGSVVQSVNSSSAGQLVFTIATGSKTGTLSVTGAGGVVSGGTFTLVP
jgi:hypothetical protein